MTGYFNKPTQVIFMDPNSTSNHIKWRGGIAYGDEIICGHNGNIIDIAILIDMAFEFGCDTIYEYHDWLNIEEEVIGEDLPDGLTWRFGKIVREVECIIAPHED